MRETQETKNEEFFISCRESDEWSRSSRRRCGINSDVYYAYGFSFQKRSIAPPKSPDRLKRIEATYLYIRQRVEEGHPDIENGEIIRLFHFSKTDVHKNISILFYYGFISRTERFKGDYSILEDFTIPAFIRRVTEDLAEGSTSNVPTNIRLSTVAKVYSNIEQSIKKDGYCHSPAETAEEIDLTEHTVSNALSFLEYQGVILWPRWAPCLITIVRPFNIEEFRSPEEIVDPYSLDTKPVKCASTQKLKYICHMIMDRTQVSDFAPSLQEIADELGVSKATVGSSINYLALNGFIRRKKSDPALNRVIEMYYETGICRKRKVRNSQTEETEKLLRKRIESISRFVPTFNETYKANIYTPRYQ